MAGNFLKILQTKTQKEKLLVIGEQGINRLKSLKPEINKIFEKNQTLGPTTYPQNWIAFINKKLNTSLKRIGVVGNFKSHSFRINFVTELLKNYPIQKVSQLVGHSELSTTLKYDRWTPTIADIKVASDVVSTS